MFYISILSVISNFSKSFSNDLEVFLTLKDCGEMNPMRHLTRASLFWKKVDKRTSLECWLWKGTIVNGYGRFWSGETFMPAHRFCYELTNGPIPEGMMVLHICGVRPCVSPVHLYLGGHDENAEDLKRHLSQDMTGISRIITI